MPFQQLPVVNLFWHRPAALNQCMYAGKCISEARLWAKHVVTLMTLNVNANTLLATFIEASKNGKEKSGQKNLIAVWGGKNSILLFHLHIFFLCPLNT